MMKKCKNEKGFTLIEMLIVLTIVSVLLILIVPNLATQNTVAQDKGCEALVSLAESQVMAYEIEEGKKPANIDDLVGKYIKDKKCAGGNEQLKLTVDADADEVTVSREDIATE
ncbi:competence type IV pilus major pilin ComGC [Radiobacillus sp. PE A8.2]|uniref:competence type IV pilus major pilin ComGC n=1 Tax=Radiobacillus sp. PE A8.2 TaxID=3380349 RepID=UPI00388F7570